MNNVTVSGRIAGEIKEGGTWARITVNTQRYDSREKKQVANYVPVTVVGEGAVGVLTKQFKRGSAIELNGELQVTTNEKDGTKYTNYDVVTFKVGFVSTDYDETTKTTGTTTDMEVPF